MRVFKVMTASERAAAELRARKRAKIASMSDLDRIVAAKAQYGNGKDRVQGFMKSSKAYSKDSDYIRARERAKTRTTNREDRERIPRIETPRAAHYRPSTNLGFRTTNTLTQIHGYSGIERKKAGI